MRAVPLMSIDDRIRDLAKVGMAVAMVVLQLGVRDIFELFSHG
jgi:hypothetical protein